MLFFRKKHILSAFLLLLPCLACLANGTRIYTRKARLEDFTSSTLRIVESGNAEFNKAMSDEVSSRWSLSPYEFISSPEYDSCRESNSFYFLSVEARDGIDFLTLRKGGREDEEESLKKPFEIVSIPICGTGGTYQKAIVYLPAFLDIIMEFVDRAMKSDTKAYSGLGQFNISNLNGKEATLDEEDGLKCFRNEEKNVVAGIIVAPAEPAAGAFFYKMLISTDTHRLYYFRKQKIKEGEIPGWNKLERIRIYGRAD